MGLVVVACSLIHALTFTHSLTHSLPRCHSLAHSDVCIAFGMFWVSTNCTNIVDDQKMVKMIWPFSDPREFMQCTKPDNNVVILGDNIDKIRATIPYWGRCNNWPNGKKWMAHIIVLGRGWNWTARVRMGWVEYCLWLGVITMLDFYNPWAFVQYPRK